MGTAPDRRREGLNRRLTERALEWCRHASDFVFLFADGDALPFYDRCGFLPRAEFTPFLRVEPREPIPGLRRLDVTVPSDRERLLDRVKRRAAVSDYLGVLDRNLFMFHALYTLPGLLYEIPELDVAIALRRKGRRVTILDIPGPRVPRFEELFPFIASPEIAEVAFGFVPDKLRLDEVEWRALRTNNLRVRHEFPVLEPELLFPFTAHA